jgi:hypothetical protein
LRSVSDLPRMGNLGFVSAGSPEFTRICAKHALWLLRYVVSEYRDSLPSYLAGAPELCQAATQFDKDVAAWDSVFPPALSRLR